MRRFVWHFADVSRGFTKGNENSCNAAEKRGYPYQEFGGAVLGLPLCEKDQLLVVFSITF